MQKKLHTFPFFLFLLLWMSVPSAKAQDISPYSDTLFVSGPSSEHLSKYLTFWIDRSGKATVNEAAGALKNRDFKHWKLNTSLNLGLNPYPVWLHLNVKNTDLKSEKYWWGFYSHADTINVFQKSSEGWKSIDTLIYGTPLADRKVKVRFSAIEVLLNGNQSKELMVKVQNYRHTQNAITDFTTPEHNLLWEKKFYWSIGFFIGCFLLISVISFFISIVLREKTFFMYGVYLLLVIAMALMEELMVPVVSHLFVFDLLKRMHSLPTAIVALGIHYHIARYIFSYKVEKSKVLKILTGINNIGLMYGIVYMLVYTVFMEKLHHGLWLYDSIWNIGIGIALLIILTTFTMIVITMKIKKLLFPGIALAFLILYFNPVSYFLNYAGLINYYKITYPNYFYWIVCSEFIAIGCFLAWRYRKKEKDHYALLKVKALQEEKALNNEIEIQEQERKQIARDLHDDLGTTLSAIKLIITNSYSRDSTLVSMITKANTDLRHFFNKLSLSDLNEYGIIHLLQEKTDQLNSIGNIQFAFIYIGKEELIPKQFKIPIIRVCTELLSNVLKHSYASEATLQLIVDPSQVQLLMEDNGKGFDYKTRKKGMGLNNIYTRVNRWNGEVHISSGVTGTTTIITLPL